MGIIHATVTNRVISPGQPISYRKAFPAGPDLEAAYNYVQTSSTTPGPGQIYQATSGPTLWINAVDADGINMGQVLSQLIAGDQITIGATTATVSLPAILNGGVFRVGIQAGFTNPTDGNYVVTFARP